MTLIRNPQSPTKSTAVICSELHCVAAWCSVHVHFRYVIKFINWNPQYKISGGCDIRFCLKSITTHTCPANPILLISCRISNSMQLSATHSCRISSGSPRDSIYTMLNRPAIFRGCFLRIYTYMYMYICIYLHVYIYTCIHIYAHTRANIYTYIYMYIHTYISPSPPQVPRKAHQRPNLHSLVDETTSIRYRRRGCGGETYRTDVCIEITIAQM